MAPEITSIKSGEFAYPIEAVGTDQHEFHLVYEGGYSDMLDTIDDDGTVEVPDGSGLGVDYDWAYIEDNATGSIHTYN
jgi:L-alanine-DL-glutamate epimerase-like enolase superfamily enzyme